MRYFRQFTSGQTSYATTLTNSINYGSYERQEPRSPQRCSFSLSRSLQYFFFWQQGSLPTITTFVIHENPSVVNPPPHPSPFDLSLPPTPTETLSPPEPDCQGTTMLDRHKLISASLLQLKVGLHQGVRAPIHSRIDPGA